MNESFYKNNKDDEDEIFIDKVKTLKNVSIDLTEIIKKQNKNLGDLQPSFSSTIQRLKGNIRQLSNMDSKQFRGFMFYAGISLIFTFLLFIFCFFM